MGCWVEATVFRVAVLGGRRANDLLSAELVTRLVSDEPALSVPAGKLTLIPFVAAALSDQPYPSLCDESAEQQAQADSAVGTYLLRKKVCGNSLIVFVWQGF